LLVLYIIIIHISRPGYNSLLERAMIGMMGS